MFKPKVVGINMSWQKIVVILVEKIYIYNLNDLYVLAKIETGNNPGGLCEIVTPDEMLYTIAFPGKEKGSI